MKQRESYLKSIYPLQILHSSENNNAHATHGWENESIIISQKANRRKTEGTMCCHRLIKVGSMLKFSCTPSVIAFFGMRFRRLYLGRPILNDFV